MSVQSDWIVYPTAPPIDSVGRSIPHYCVQHVDEYEHIRAIYQWNDVEHIDLSQYPIASHIYRDTQIQHTSITLRHERELHDTPAREHTAHQLLMIVTHLS